MASMALSSSLAAQSSSHYRHHVFPPKRCFLSIDSTKQTHHIALSLHSSTPISKKALRLSSVCFSKDNNKSKADIQPKETGLGWPILKRWDVPWGWQTVCLTLLLSGLSLSTAVALGVVYGIVNKFRPLPEDIFCYDWREPFSRQKGWLLWAGIGFLGTVIAVYFTGASMSFLNGGILQTDVLGRLLPLVGSSSISIAYLLGITSVFAPLLEETLFRGFLMVSLTKWDCFGIIICQNP